LRAAETAAELRAATAADLDLLLPLFQDMAEHYAMPPMDAATVRRRLDDALFGERPCAEAIVACAAGRGLGFVTFNTSFPAMALGRRLMVEDVYVRRGERGHGLGLALLRAAAARAEALGASELAWTTEWSNEAAQRFYDRLGARRVEKVVYRMGAAALRSAAAGG